MNADLSKFSISEALNNTNGKTSGSKVAGAMVVTTGCICLLMSSISTVLGNPNGIALSAILSSIIIAGLTLFGYSRGKSAQENISEHKSIKNINNNHG